MDRKNILLIFGFIALAMVGFFGWKVFHQSSEQAFSNGDLFPEIRLTNPEGDSISLSSLKGNIVLVQFWASWCGPCRRENAELVPVYEKYKNDEMQDGGTFKIYSVSLDKKKSAWRKAIANDGLTWSEQVNDSGDFKSSIAQAFSVHQIPTTYLLDQNGMVIGVDLSIMQLENILENRKK
ncbi:MAG TPA: TlpA family protein disulfide reductase [Bacteroidetes bacterium]|nr:TlpA family protein disulfide reductase [Bacteroidota bacterium]